MGKLITNEYDEVPVSESVEDTYPRARESEIVTESQRRMSALVERHKALLAFNERLEAAIKNRDAAVIDECIEHSRKHDYMAEHRQYVIQLTQELAKQVNN